MGLVRNAWVRPSGGLRLCDRELQRRGDGLRPRNLDDGLRALAELAGDSERSTQKLRAFMHPANSQSRTGQTTDHSPAVVTHAGGQSLFLDGQLDPDRRRRSVDG